MRRLIPILLAMALLTALTGCYRNNDGQYVVPTENVLEIPSRTPETTLRPSEPPSQEPLPTLTPVTMAMTLSPGVYETYDLNNDGTAERITIAETNRDDDAYTKDYVVAIDLKDRTYAHHINGAYACGFYLIDCDENDGRIELIASYEHDSDDHTTIAMRIDRLNESVCTFTIDGSLTPENAAAFDRTKILNILSRTDLFGTHILQCAMSIDEDGFYLTDEDKKFVTTDDEWLKLKTTMVIIPIDTEQNAHPMILPAGNRVRPVSTDEMTYAIMSLTDGALFSIRIEFINTDEEYGYLIEGADQTSYFDDLIFAD